MARWLEQNLAAARTAIEADDFARARNVLAGAISDLGEKAENVEGYFPTKVEGYATKIEELGDLNDVLEELVNPGGPETEKLVGGIPANWRAAFVEAGCSFPFRTVADVRLWVAREARTRGGDYTLEREREFWTIRDRYATRFTKDASDAALVFYFNQQFSFLLDRSRDPVAATKANALELLDGLDAELES